MGPITTVDSDLAVRAVENSGLRYEISDILREAIWRGRLRPGQRLNEQWLATEMGVSRPPLREAIRVLEQEGLVVSVPRRGAFVRQLTGDDIFEIYVVRCALEGMAAELLVASADEESTAQLQRIIDRVESPTTDDLRAKIDEDLQFHRTLVRLSGNVRLAAMWEQLAGQLRLALTLVDPSFFDVDYVELTHRSLVEAIARGDSVAAWKLTKALLDVGRSLRERWNAELAEAGANSGSTEPAALTARVEDGQEGSQ
jgi:DNA-binding GntR family transcriptional regulator